MNQTDMDFDDAEFDDADFDDSGFDDLADLFPDASRAPIRMRAAKARAFRDHDDAPPRGHQRAGRRSGDRQLAHR